MSDHGIGGQPGEGGEAAEEVLELAVLDLELEVGADLGMQAQQGVEHRAVQRSASTSPLARTVAVRCPPSSSAISPKVSPGCRKLSGISSPFSPCLSTRARPETSR